MRRLRFTVSLPLLVIVMTMVAASSSTKRLLSHSVKGQAPSSHIIVKNGRVTLKGFVLNKGDSNYAYLKARGVFGSFAMTNELQIEPPEKNKLMLNDWSCNS